MTKSLDPFRFLLIAVSGWMNQQQLQLIDLSLATILAGYEINSLHTFLNPSL
jgi:hypothetical protein